MSDSEDPISALAQVLFGDDSAKERAVLEQKIRATAEGEARLNLLNRVREMERQMPHEGDLEGGRKKVYQVIGKTSSRNRARVSNRVVQLMLGLAVAVVVAIKVVPSHSPLRETIQAGPQTLRDTLQLVRFLLTAPPGTHMVAIAGNFAEPHGSRTPLQYDRAHDQWTGVLVLAPGTYHYRFVVNDTGWLLDPHARSTVDKSGRNVSVVTVTATGAHFLEPAQIRHDT